MSRAGTIAIKRELKSIRRKFILAASWGFFVAPILGYGGAILFGMTRHASPEAIFSSALLVMLLSVALTVVAALHFSVYLRPILQWVAQHPDLGAAPAKIHRRVRRFTLDYWLIHIAYVVAAPFLLVTLGALENHYLAEYTAPSHFVLLQVVASILVGLPGFLMGLNGLGRLVAYVGLDRVHVSLRYKLVILVGFIPLLSSALLSQYYWWRTGYVSFETSVVWAALGSLPLVMALLAVRGLQQGLQPVREMLEADGEVSHDELSKLRPQSVDEIGYLTQMLAKLMRRLGDQDAQVRAIVGNAAEGIILVDDMGRIDTFNRAAENLFGYRFQEVRGRPLAWLLPTVVNLSGTPNVVAGEQEVDGIHNRGRKIPMSVRVSEMELSGKRMYTCLVADISERKASQKQIIHAESRFRHLVETAHDLVWSIDLQARWTYLNVSARNIYGYDPQDMLGRPVRDFQSDDYSEQDFNAFTEILRGKELVQYDTAHVDRSGGVHYLSFNAKAYRDPEGNIIGISGTARDITEQRAFERKLAHQALHDSLTGLANRRQFQQELERVLARVARSGAMCSLFYIDLDQFKYINDTVGHAAGDRLLIEFSNRLKGFLREGDLLARFGGDEFTVLLYNVDTASALRVAENLRKRIEDYRFLEQGNVYNISCSIGIAMIDNTTVTVDESMAHADLACHLAKTAGRNRVYMYKPEDQDRSEMQADMGWAARVKDVLERDQLQLVYQPIASVADGIVRDYEVLLRMLCDDGQVIMPGGFMPAAERFGLINQVDRWMVRHAIAELGRRQSEGEDMRFSVNLSARAFEDDSLLPLIRDLLTENQVQPQTLTFEITETAAIGNLAAAIEFITALKSLGCQFALDDFGSGFSSFTYLKHLPVDKIKIDGSFVQNMAQTPVDQAMVRSMNQVAHALGKTTIAEFVENEETLRMLRSIGVDFAQGYFIGKPRQTIPVSAAADVPLFERSPPPIRAANGLN